MFPKDFLWGAATSSHQVEGNNTKNDWWAWEREGRVKYPSGDATRHYEFFDSDFKCAFDLHHNAHRFSIEWSRIEPEEGKFNEEEIKHYQDVIFSIRKYRMVPIITLHHFTNPKWFADQGGWLNDKACDWFLRYVEKIIAIVGKEVQFWVTINEPEIFAYHGYLQGIWPPGEHSAKKAQCVLKNLIHTHKKTYLKIHQIYEKNLWPKPKVSIAKNIMVFKPCLISNNPLRYLSIFLRNRYFNNYFLEKIKGHMDFIGVNYYLREFVSVDKVFNAGIIGAKCNKVHGHVKHVDAMGWDSYPQGLFEILCRLKKYHLPILITENGTCENDENLRWQFIYDHLTAVQKAIAKRIPVIGYVYWSLLDNFEWHHGFGPRFGLLEVDYDTYERKPRPSAIKLSAIYKTNKLSGVETVK